MLKQFMHFGRVESHYFFNKDLAVAVRSDHALE